MVWKIDDINIMTSRILDNLVTIALQDNIVTDDEEAIIESVRQGLWDLEEEIKASIDLPAHEFKRKIREIFNSVLKEVIQTARLDGSITSDERDLISSIRKFMTEENIQQFF